MTLRSHWKTLTACALAALLAACGAESGDASEKTSDAAATGDASAGETPADVDAAVIQSNDMVMGSPDAPVTVIEYASTTCPACANFHLSTFPEIKEKYVDTGKVKFVFREFPTSPVEFSLIGSVLARCAAEKSGSDAYFLVLGSLFKTQRQWISGEDPKLELLKIASQAGMDEAAFDSCLKRQELVELVQANSKAAVEQFRISGTPSFVLNGEKMAFKSLDDFFSLLDEALGEDAPAGEESEDPATEEAPANEDPAGE